MNFFTTLIGIALIVLGVDGYFNNGIYTNIILTPNYDIAMGMIIMGSLVLLCGLCLFEFGKRPQKPANKATPKSTPKNALPH